MLTDVTFQVGATNIFSEALADRELLREAVALLSSGGGNRLNPMEIGSQASLNHAELDVAAPKAAAHRALKVLRGCPQRPSDMDTNALIDALVADLRPVRPLLPPVWRLLGWLAVSTPAIGAVVAIEGCRSDIAARLTDATFLTEQIAAVATALVAGWAALVASVPGTSRWKWWTPLIPLTMWMLSLGHQCWTEWARVGARGMEFHSDWMCVPNIALTGAVPALAIVIAIRHGARLTSAPVLWGGLAAAALANAALRLFHPEDAALMVIVWQSGSVALFTTVLAALRRLLVPIASMRRML